MPSTVIYQNSFSNPVGSTSFGTGVTTYGNITYSSAGGQPAVYFDGSSYLGISNANLNQTLSNYSISFLFKADGAQQNYSTMCYWSTSRLPTMHLASAIGHCGVLTGLSSGTGMGKHSTVVLQVFFQLLHDTQYKGIKTGNDASIETTLLLKSANQGNHELLFKYLPVWE